ncbi:alpha-mannosidase [Cohnella hashimotonis]|uniref:Alpha-mannosidase n=1 Tax=Cohnella hashimotonis TaxID=2826895 RepID=A0ABT6TN90_9BACL|nr:alpha-mannosidase [Cohnella hashimotonis]MDI4647307.1 alpha-mannosidase [Cohnella hashimotonis]
MKKMVAHIVSHTHWDREWYMPYERHHVRLIELMDVLLDTLERDPDYRSFHLDGQTIILDDYLEVRPEMRERLTRLIREGRILIGPWYVLQDEFLTSAEANVRNLLVGHHDAARYGPVAKIGYFPDSFGNMGQAPQLMRQAGIANAIFGRGVKPTGFNNAVSDSAAYESPFSEMIWRSPDGSEVLGILFANWYNNGMEIPVDPDAARVYWDAKLKEAERFASTPQLLFMNGCDHQPVQTDLAAALRTARDLYPGYEFVHSDLPSYVAAVERASARELTVVEGELRSQRTDGWFTLANTASSRVYIKQANAKGQILLERLAEPAAAIAATLGMPHPTPLLVHAWRTLMQNHPHDSICGCSVDEVHAEMMTRFAKSRHMAEPIVERSIAHIASSIDTARFAGDAHVPFVVFNFAGAARSGTVSVELDVARRSSADIGPAAAYADMELIRVGAGAVIDHEGRPVDAEIEDLGVRFGYELPDDKFRQPYMARRIRVTLSADHVPSQGYRTYAWRSEDDAVAAPVAAAVEQEKAVDASPAGLSLENEYIAVAVEPNGSLSLTDKETGEVYRDLGVFENTGDIGNEYVYVQDGERKTLTTDTLKAEVRLVSRSAWRTTVEIVHRWEIPAEADVLLQRERTTMTFLPDRKAGRSARTVPLVITTLATVERGVKALMLKVRYENHAKDHRLRMRFPTDAAASGVHYADSIFEIAERPNEPAGEWRNPSNAQHQQAFAALDHGKRGLAVANIGLNEYEALRDGRGTLAVTLLRAVGELGDWGVFPTPEAQCPGSQEAELAIIPYAGADGRYAAAQEAYAFQVPWLAVQTDAHAGSLPAVYSPLSWTGERLALTAFKRGIQGEDCFYRWFNMSGASSSLALRAEPDSEWYLSNVLEEELGKLVPDADGIVRVDVRPCEIVTIGRRLS